MKKIKVILTLGLFTTTSLMALNCSDSATQRELNECAYQETKMADKEIGRVYQLLMSRLDKEGQTKLRDAQRKWIKFKEANAEFAADAYRGGSMEGMVYTNAIKESTIQRTKELKVLFEDYNH
jgi:uncharacterized protein YecT (DUF1311 family)